MNVIKYRSRTGIRSKYKEYRNVSIFWVFLKCKWKCSKYTQPSIDPTWFTPYQLWYWNYQVGCYSSVRWCHVIYLSWVYFYYMTSPNWWITSNLVVPISKLIWSKPSWINRRLCVLWTFPFTFEKNSENTDVSVFFVLAANSSSWSIFDYIHLL